MQYEARAALNPYILSPIQDDRALAALKTTVSNVTAEAREGFRRERVE